jgi:hypothetical protein
LAWYKKGNYSPLLTAWENFIAEFKLPAEITTFSISSKQRFYIRLGSWKEKTHPQVTPLVIWKKACHDGSYPLPKLRISSLSMRFASDMADLGFNLLQNLEGVSKSEESFWWYRISKKPRQLITSTELIKIRANRSP